MNEFCILLVMNIVFVLMLNFDKSVVNDIHAFFKNYIYGAVPSLLSIPFTYYFDEIFGYISTGEQFQNKIADMFEKDTNKTYIKSMSYFVIQVCFVFFLTSMFYIYMRETFTVLLNMNKKEKSTAGFAMFVTGLVVFYVLGIILQEAMATEGNKIITLIIAMIIIAGIAFMYFKSLNYFYFRHLANADGELKETSTADVVKDKINNTLAFVINLGKELFFSCGKLIVGLLCVFLCLFILFYIYDKFNKNPYRKYVDNKRKVFHSICYVVYGIGMGFIG